MQMIDFHEGGRGRGGGFDIRTKVKSLHCKINIAERTRNCESLLLRIT